MDARAGLGFPLVLFELFEAQPARDRPRHTLTIDFTARNTNGSRHTERSKSKIGRAGKGSRGTPVYRGYAPEGQNSSGRWGRCRTVTKSDVRRVATKQFQTREASKILDKHDRVMRFVEDEFIHQLLR